MSFNLPMKTIESAATLGAHFLDHPITIRAAEKGVPWVYPVGSALLLGSDLFKADGIEEKKKTLLRDTLVLGATVAGTVFGTKWLMHEEHALATRAVDVLKNLKNEYSPLLKEKITQTVLKDELWTSIEMFGERFAELVKGPLKALQGAESPEVKQQAFSTLKDQFMEAIKEGNHAIPGVPEFKTQVGALWEKVEKAFTEAATDEQKLNALSVFKKEVTSLLSANESKSVSLGDFRKTFWGMWGETAQAIKAAKTPREKLRALLGAKRDMQKVFPLTQEGEESFREQIKKALAFFGVGAISVSSGAAGGLVANHLNKGDKETKINIFKEAVFQFVANIAMCAIGAMIGLSVVNGLKLKSRLFRIPIVSAGLSLGIVGGGFIANFVGRTLINPLCDWFDSDDRSGDSLKERLSKAWNTKGNNRKIEFSDIILHLDDLPTALAIAGMKVMGPFIPPFFAFSGYRAGIGYRNVGEGHHHGHDIPNRPSFAGEMGSTTPSHLMAQNNVFATFYQQQHASRGVAAGYFS